MIIKVIPTKFEVDAKDPESPLKVEYVVELTTEIYSDIMSSGLTYINDETIQKCVETLAEAVQAKIEADLGLKSPTIEQPTIYKEEDL